MWCHTENYNATLQSAHTPTEFLMSFSPYFVFHYHNLFHLLAKHDPQTDVNFLLCTLDLLAEATVCYQDKHNNLGLVSILIFIFLQRGFILHPPCLSTHAWPVRRKETQHRKHKSSVTAMTLIMFVPIFLTLANRNNMDRIVGAAGRIIGKQQTTLDESDHTAVLGETRSIIVDQEHHLYSDTELTP